MSQKYRKSAIMEMNDDDLYRLAKHTLNIHGCGTMGTPELRNHILAQLLDKSLLEAEEGPQSQPSTSTTPTPRAVAAPRSVVTATYPPYSEEYEQLVGKTVYDARAALTAAWSIEPRSRIYVNGTIVAENALMSTRLAPGDRLEFVKAASEKG